MQIQILLPVLPASSSRKIFQAQFKATELYTAAMYLVFHPLSKVRQKHHMPFLILFFPAKNKQRKALSWPQILHMLGSWWSRKRSQILHHFLMQSLHPEGIHLPVPSSHHEVKLLVIHELMRNSQSPDTQLCPKGSLMPQYYFRNYLMWKIQMFSAITILPSWVCGARFDF